MKYEYFDLNKKYNCYGKVVKIDTISKENLQSTLKKFSEGSTYLEELLKILYDLGLKTRACCKGSHLSYNSENMPNVSSAAYVMFEDDKWLKFLSTSTIENKNIIISNKSIHYYGENNDKFFEDLINDFKSGEKINIEMLKNKLQVRASKQMKQYKYKLSLYEIGFDENEVNELCNLFFDFKEYNSKIKNASSSDIDIIRKMSDNKWKKYNDTLIQVIMKKNNQTKIKIS